jgi:hypothetical protein
MARVRRAAPRRRSEPAIAEDSNPWTGQPLNSAYRSGEPRCRQQLDRSRPCAAGYDSQLPGRLNTAADDRLERVM